MGFLDGWFTGGSMPTGSPTAQPVGPTGGIGDVLMKLAGENSNMLGMTGLGLLTARTAQDQRNALMQGYVYGSQSDRLSAKNKREEEEAKRKRDASNAAMDALRKQFPDDPTVAALAGAYPDKVAELYLSGKKGPTPTDEIREYQFDRSQWTADPNNAGKSFPAFGEWKTKLRQAGATTVHVGAPEKAFDVELAKSHAKSAAELEAAGTAAAANLRRLNITGQFLEGAETGKLAKAGMTMGAWARSAGVSDETLKGFGIDPKVLVSREVVGPLINQQIMGMIGPGGIPANGFSNADREFVEKSVVSLANQPETNRELIEIGKRVEQRKIQIAREWAEARKKGVSWSDFNHDLAIRAENEPGLFDDIRGRLESRQPAATAPVPAPAALPPGVGGAPTRNPPGTVPRIKVDAQGRITP